MVSRHANGEQVRRCEADEYCRAEKQCPDNILRTTQILGRLAVNAQRMVVQCAKGLHNAYARAPLTERSQSGNFGKSRIRKDCTADSHYLSMSTIISKSRKIRKIEATHGPIAARLCVSVFRLPSKKERVGWSVILEVTAICSSRSRARYGGSSSMVRNPRVRIGTSFLPGTFLRDG
ncbi:hypothetical protein PLICRDRAFT_339377 [Plicaturopsis crispa FD-325 SS-3]|uniref:Uncharacterized protein n=1 Tax=Plicaturopsis crispa FD-325 SS-3 TaxID=944288 RepID=A0A0C9T7J8_PLICR|nr:hypothetical protein PLICRDRAFT_339377 [Plicaturopsis crispa FD-325 SS-3]